MSKFYLYKITNKINDKSYIGVTKDPKKRYRDHLSGNGSKNIAKDKHMQFSFTILVCGSERYIYSLEAKAIEVFNTIDPFGYNINIGGSGGSSTNRKGELNTSCVLSEATVLEIRYAGASRELTHLELANKYGVTRENISYIMRGDSWAHVGGPRTRRKLITMEQKLHIAELAKAGFSKREISTRLNISISSVYANIP